MQSNLLATPASLQKNIKRQAKRLSAKLDIPLTYAKGILAQAAYHCASWEDLSARLQTTSHSGALLLAYLPGSADSILYFRTNVQEIARQIGRRVLTNHNLMGMISVLWFVFANEDRDISLTDVIPELPSLPWRTTGIASDPSAVIESQVTINNEPMRLIGTKVYLPQYLNLGEELQPLAHLAADFGSPFEIMWSNPAAWHAAAVAYLSASDDDFDDTPLHLPCEQRTTNMIKHESWFRTVLAAWSNVTTYGEYEETEFRPLVTTVGCYLVFGFPSVAIGSPNRSGEFEIPGLNDDGNDAALFTVQGHPLCLDWHDVPVLLDDDEQENLECSANAAEAIYSHPDYLLRNGPSLATAKRMYFIRPASDWDIRYNMQLAVTPNPGEVATVIKSDSIELTDLVLQKVADRELTRYTSEEGFDHSVMELDVSGLTSLRGFSLSFDLIGENETHWSSLISVAMTYTEDMEKCHMILELNDRIFILLEKLGKAAVLEAARHGFVLHGTQSLNDAIDKVPKWCHGLPETSQKLRARLDDRFEDIEKMMLSELWRHVRIPKYRRDNF